MLPDSSDEEKEATVQVCAATENANTMNTGMNETEPRLMGTQPVRDLSMFHQGQRAVFPGPAQFPYPSPYMPVMYGQVPMMSYCPMYPPPPPIQYAPGYMPYAVPYMPPPAVGIYPNPMSHQLQPQMYCHPSQQETSLQMQPLPRKTVTRPRPEPLPRSRQNEPENRPPPPCQRTVVTTRQPSVDETAAAIISASVPTSESKEERPPVLLNFDLNVPAAGEARPTLADMFKEKKREMAERAGTTKEQKEQRPKTKEELIQKRKEMLRHSSTRVNSRRSPSVVEPAKPSPNQLLMSRLAAGARPTISKAEMLRLTQKNYQLLPEVVKRKEEERKRLENLERVQNARKREKVLKTRKYG